MKKILMSILAILFFINASNAYAEGACDDKDTGRGTTQKWTLKIKDNSTDHNYKKRISVPLLTPEITEVEVGEYRVLAKKEKKEGPPPMFGDALEAAFIAASRPPNKLVEYLNGAIGNEEFNKSCMKNINNDMKNNKLLGKKVIFVPFNNNNDKETSGEEWRYISTCYVDGKNGKKIEVTIRGKTAIREVRKNKTSAGKMNVDFSVASSGTIEKPTINANFVVTSKPPQPVDTPEAHIKSARIKIAYLKSKVGEEIKLLQARLNNLLISLSKSEQESLCSGDKGQIEKSISFKAFKKTYNTNLIISAKKDLVLGMELGKNPFCDSINCDCKNISAGLLTRHWISACEGEQSSAIKRCHNDGKMHKCTMEGPNPHYPSMSIPSNLRVE